MKRHFSASFVCAAAFLLLSFSARSAQVNVLTYHNDNSRAGQNLNETILMPSNVNTNTFGKLFSYSVDGCVYAQPLYVSGINIPGQGTHNLVFVATQHDSVYAFDADSNTALTNGLLWRVSLGTSAVTPNSDFGGRYHGGLYTDIQPEVGITGTPVIDAASGTLYVDAFTHEGGNYFHRLHALNITNGAEQVNSPVLVTASVPGAGVDSTNGVLTLNHRQHLQRSALTLAGGILFVTYTGFADTDPYHGWIVGFDPAMLQQLTNYIFNTTPNSTVAGSGANAGEGGLWMGGNGLAVDAANNLFFEVGNGSFNALNGMNGTEYGDSFMKLSISNRFSVADYFTPNNQAALALGDQDVGSGGLILLPDQSGSVPHLLVGAGKQGRIYLINRDQMTVQNNHYDSAGATDHIVQSVSSQIGGSFDTPAYFNGRIFYAGSGDKLKSFSLNNGLLSTAPVSTGPRAFSFPGATPSVSANGTNNGIIWATAMGNPAVLTAYNPTNLATELYNSSQAAGSRDRLASGVKFAVPTVANGKVYVGTTNSISVFGLLAAYDNWRYAHFGTAAVSEGDLDDPDNDGAVNLLEYALATDPDDADTSPAPTATITGGDFQFHFPRNKSATDVTFIVETSDSLASWTPLMTYTAGSGWVANSGGATVSESAPAGLSPDQYVNVTIDLGAPGAGSQFLRLRVHR